MKKLTDEILNKYLDNEISTSELTELKTYLSNNPGDAEKFKAHKLVDEVLRKMEYESAPDNFTVNLMEKLSKIISEKPKKHYFIWAVFSFLGISFIGILFFGLTNLTPAQSSNTDDVFVRIGEGLDKLVPRIDSLSFSINPDLLMLIVSTLFLVTLIAAYVMINSHKAFKEKIENFSH
ncbi:MAG: hypothetical protein U5K00_19635 [Melioribacteraceae bacterium]|nr:hypothetical protein [Melioribacteraceae bacterium]